MTTPTNKSFGLLADSDRLNSLINEAKIPFEVSVLAEVSSTQKYLLALSPKDLPNGKTLVAHHQLAGIGRLDRTWESQSGDSILMSHVFHEGSETLPLFVGNAVLKALQPHLPELKLKWPNDLVVEVNGRMRKLGGIVLQKHQGAANITVAGIGINLKFSAQRPTQEAIALNELIDELPEINQLIFEILLELSKPAKDVIAKYKENCLTLGKQVVVQKLNANDVIGLAVDITEAGHLIVSNETDLVEVLSGDVKHLRTSE